MRRLLPRYLFDVHVEGYVRWDDEGVECSDRAEIESRVRHLMTEAAADPDNAGKSIVGYVAEDGGGIVLTATMKAQGDFRLVWSKM